MLKDKCMVRICLVNTFLVTPKKECLSLLKLKISGKNIDICRTWKDYKSIDVINL